MWHPINKEEKNSLCKGIFYASAQKGSGFIPPDMPTEWASPEGFLQPPGSVKILMMNDIFDGDFRDRTVSILNTREMDRPAMREWNVGKR